MATEEAKQDEFKPRSGFQGSERTGAKVIIYPQGGDPLAISSEPPGPISFDGRSRKDTNASLVAVNTDKVLGAASGTWSFTCKPGKGDRAAPLLESVSDDDWVDIILTRHGRSWHVMRGLVGSNRHNKSIGGSGATTTSYTISGTDFGSIWEKTPIWFNPYSSVNLGGAISMKVFSAMENVLGSPKRAIQAFLFGMLREISGQGQGTWVLPEKLPNGGGGSFLDAIFIDDEGYPEDLDSRLVGLSQNWLNPSGNLWQQAKEWSDPLFNELFCDLLAPPGGGGQDQSLLPADTTMSVTFREKPFPTVADGSDSAWFRLPMAVVSREATRGREIGRSGAERYNAFFVAPQVMQEALGRSAIDMLQPLWHPEDIRRHGFRRFDVTTKYADKNADLLTVASDMRTKVRDWYCLNPCLLSGTVPLGLMRPDIRIGTRLRIKGPTEADDETFYVEQVSHSWSFNSGKTALGVTRGWRGTDDSLVAALRDVTSGYDIPSAIQPGEEAPT